MIEVLINKLNNSYIEVLIDFSFHCCFGIFLFFFQSLFFNEVLFSIIFYLWMIYPFIDLKKEGSIMLFTLICLSLIKEINLIFLLSFFLLLKSLIFEKNKTAYLMVARLFLLLVANIVLEVIIKNQGWPSDIILCSKIAIIYSIICYSDLILRYFLFLLIDRYSLIKIPSSINKNFIEIKKLFYRENFLLIILSIYYFFTKNSKYCHLKEDRQKRLYALMERLLLITDEIKQLESIKNMSTINELQKKLIELETYLDDYNFGYTILNDN
ncbi:MAG: hypothetical protein COB02_17605 [Candidatus Cloacimonadota bacterium]|nr:MAG: hypothetical protein COB02_17605 [Candidatus Cloacimonadota bacterium]